MTILNIRQYIYTFKPKNITMKNTFLIFALLVSCFYIFSCSKDNSTTINNNTSTNVNDSTDAQKFEVAVKNYLIGTWTYDSLIDYNEGTTRDSCKLMGEQKEDMDPLYDEYNEVTYLSNGTYTSYSPHRTVIYGSGKYSVNYNDSSITLMDSTITVTHKIDVLNSTTHYLRSNQKKVTCQATGEQITVPFIAIYKKK